MMVASCLSDFNPARINDIVLKGFLHFHNICSGVEYLYGTCFGGLLLECGVTGMSTCTWM